MIKLGEIQELEVAKIVDFGVYLISSDDEEGEDRILLPIKQVPENTEIKDKINVFVYRDSDDRIIATVRRPKIAMGEIAYLKVAEMSRIGAFMNWGLEKDLFLPFKEQVGEIKLNGEYLVGLYIDKSNRLCATMNLFNVLRTDSPYKVNDMVTGTVFSLKRGLGAMVAVEGKYLGLIHEGEILKPLSPGDVVEIRVSNIKEDGKLDLSLKDAPRLQIDKDGEKLLSALSKNKGMLPLNDDSRPELINETLNMSKSSFKKAIGRLMKRGVIEMTKDGIRIADEDTKKDDAQKRQRTGNSSSSRNYSRNNSRNSSTGNSNSKASYSSYKKENRENYKTSDKPDNRTSYQTSDKPDNKTFNKPDNRTGYKKTDKPDNRTSYQTSDKPENKTFNKPDNRTGYKKTDKPDNRTSYKTSDKPENKTFNKPDNRTGYKKTDKPDNRTGYKASDKTDNKTFNKPDNRTSYKTSDKPENKTFNKTDNKTGYKTTGKSNDKYAYKNKSK